MHTHPRHHLPAALPTVSRNVAAATVLFATLLSASGCRVRHTNGAHDDLSVDTPIGGVSVRRDTAAVLDKVGLPAYPGARPIAETDGNHDSANVDLSFGGFKLQVMVAKLRTPDDRGKVEAFYRTALAQYSDVIACRDNKPIGTPTKTGMGLTCARDKHVSSDEDHGDKEDGLQLKAGSPSRQHIVALWTSGAETHMDLIALELPKGLVD